MGRLFDLVGNGIGFATEYNQHRRSVNAPRPVPNQRSSQYNRTDSSVSYRQSNDELCDEDEKPRQSAYYKKQDAADEKGFDWTDAPPPYQLDAPTTVDNERPRNSMLATRQFTSNNPLRQSSGIPLPVIIPQRRPGSKARGFDRAYAPVLDNVGIDLDTFLHFLKDFHKSSQASPWFKVINVSAGIAGFAPSMTAQLVCLGAQVGARVGEEAQMRHNTNSFLSKANETLFKPAGLFAMIITYNPNPSSAASGLAGISTKTMSFGGSTPVSSSSGAAGGLGGLMGNVMKPISSGETSEMQMPESAPLIYPEPEKEVREGPETFKDKSKDFSKFLSGYMDRRAQTKFAQDNPTSTLSHQNAQRGAGGGSNPLQGGLRGLASQSLGVPLEKDRSRDRVRDRSRDYGRDRRQGDRRSRDRRRRRDSSSSSSSSSSSDSSRSRSRSRDSRGKDKGKGGIGGMMKQDVLYLLIVNLPSESELERARWEMGM